MAHPVASSSGSLQSEHREPTSDLGGATIHYLPRARAACYEIRSSFTVCANH